MLKTTPKKLRVPNSSDATRPVIAGYADYRAYLRDMYAYLKSVNPKLSYRSLAAGSGLKSPGFLNLVLHGKRNLGKDLRTVNGIIQGFQLSKGEGKLFSQLVVLNQDRNPDRRQRRFRKLVMHNREFREHHQIDEAQLEYFQSWHAVAIHELAGWDKFIANPAWIARQFPFGMTRQEAAKALDLLLRLGLLVEQPNGEIVRRHTQVKTADEIHRETIRHYHLQVGRMACEALSVIPADKRNFGAVTGRVAAADLPAVLAFMHRLRNDFHTYLETLETGQAETVIQATFQLFPLTRIEEKT
jgi:uncharacterized protein (TIGR02147 family)